MANDDYDRVPCQYCGMNVMEILLHVHESMCPDNPKNAELHDG